MNLSFASRVGIALISLCAPLLAVAQSFQAIAPPNGNGIQPFAVRSGKVAGNYFDAQLGSRAFIWSATEGFVSFQAPGADPGVGTYASGLDSFGRVTGWFVDTDYVTRAFVRSASGAIKVFEVPSPPFGSAYTTPVDMNGLGFITGEYRPFGDESFTPHGFIRSPIGHLLRFNYPGAVMTQPWAINESGVVVGYHGPQATWMEAIFIRTPPGHFRSVAARPDCMFTEGNPLYLNNRGDIAGSCLAAPDHLEARGYVRTRDGATQIFTVPGAWWVSVSGIAGNGDIAGTWFASDAVTHGFIRSADGTITTFDYPGPDPAGYTTVTRVDENGDIVGTYGSYTPTTSTVIGFIRYASRRP